MKLENKVEINLIKDREELGELYEYYRDIFKDLQSLTKLTEGISFRNTSEEELNLRLRKVVEKISVVQNNKYFNLFDKLVVLIKKRIDMKWVDKISIELIKLRKERGFSQSKLARLSSVSNGYIWRYEKGQRNNITIGTLNKIAKALGTDIPALISKVSGKDSLEVNKLKGKIKNLEDEIIKLKKKESKKDLEKVIEYINDTYAV